MDDIVHEQTIINFVDSHLQVTWWALCQWKGIIIITIMIIIIIVVIIIIIIIILLSLLLLL